ncbi:hypothetical protein SADUNF_Sadunf11G0067500 [Salix dunnii]|uniref:CCHC-type domain-containing protein n=1 Tax=Salix dunnii TaxID=1413687 RepID=A0A835JNH6_9ROSI|nr:hypothetical protein SADUNF_Sadunf11G0067500 [Salix dunnii]
MNKKSDDDAREEKPSKLDEKQRQETAKILAPAVNMEELKKNSPSRDSDTPRLQRASSKPPSTDRTKRNEDKAKNNQGEKSTIDARNYGIKRKFEGKCYNYVKKGHMAKDCLLNKESIESNVVTFKPEDEWDTYAFFTTIGRNNLYNNNI